ncbi:PAS domain-containing sensor histidine kinase [Kordiimonas sp. SCSIO 12610]|uniref:PAS domain-containing sensor histidine kinase n=1 Tax=Kordiimonas sp. SCSIO 12610 TaxID=2829597 RepID=UPI00210EBE4C|nr:PAS domain-containing sensor histidine kinase [Kordiimonas sp. SCSIO 12610]UTW54878.1 PAS domain-containing sensor histidine kinase [Kordiimonas sp. SCSIO 12610]
MHEESASSELAIFDALAEGVLVRQNNEIVFCNTQLLNMLRFDGSKNDFLSQPLASWVHEDDLDTLRTYHYSRTMGEDVPVNYTFRVMRADGEKRVFSCRASVGTWLGSKASIACLFDITDQLEAEREREYSQQIFHNVFRLTPEVMVIAEIASEKIIDINPAFLNIFGARRDDVVGKKATDLDIWADPTFYERFVKELKITSSITDMPVIMRTRGNIVRHFKFFAQTITSTKKPAMLIVGRDVTEDIAQAEELQKNRDIAELANRTKSEFLANMSHELRTPLNAILGFAEIIKDEILGPVGIDKYKEYAGDVYNSGTHLLSIINDILDLSKVEAGKLQAHLVWIDPLESMEICLNLVKQRAIESSVNLVENIDKDILLEADEKLVRQICLNLLTNAVKFTPAGGEVSLSLKKLDNGELCISVKDTGVGMTPAEIKVAKRPFGQIQSSISRDKDGVGLGLPLVSSFADKLHAQFTLESEPGVGTTASVIFPEFKVRSKTEQRKKER